MTKQDYKLIADLMISNLSATINVLKGNNKRFSTVKFLAYISSVISEWIAQEIAK